MLEAGDGPKTLTTAQKKQIELLMLKIKDMGENCPDFVDPKFLGMMEISFEMLAEQIVLDKVYEIDNRPKTKEDVFMFEDDVPSTDDLEKWMADPEV